MYSKVLADSTARPTSPTLSDNDDEPEEIVELNPELARIAQAVQRQILSVSPNREVGPSTITTGPVKLSVKWIPHPEDAAGRSKSWNFTINRVYRHFRGSFYVLIAFFADRLIRGIV